MCVLQFNIRRTDKCLSFIPSIGQTCKTTTTILLGRLASDSLMALHTRIPRLTGASADATGTFGIFVVRVLAAMATLDGSEKNEIEEWAEGRQAGWEGVSQAL